MSEHYGPKTASGESIHAEKYRGKGESFKEAMNRVASALTDDSDHYQDFRDILLKQRFLPGGRVQSAIGSTKNVTPYNCYVSGTIEDSFVEGGGSIMKRATQAAATMRMGGGIGYDFSTLRPRGDMIKKLHSQSSGPISFMGIYDAICKCIASSGHRRGAQMGVLRVDHPDIEEFVRAKQNHTNLTGFNISVAVTDKFMEAVRKETSFPLQFEGQVYKEINARALWETIMRSTWDWAEPGILFIDRINQMNNLYYCETIAATNPCGEQPLPPFGACLLGSFNLPAYMYKADSGQWCFDNLLFVRDIPIVVRAMDNVIDRAIYPLYEQEKEAKSKRRMGLGVTGLANAVEAWAGGPCYGEPKFITFAQRIFEKLRNETYRASALLAKEKGVFPLYEDRYVDGQFIDMLPSDVVELIRKHGIRNSHLTSIAPTGTISLTADNVSSGIEPVFAYEIERIVQTFDGPIQERLYDYGVANFGVRGKQSDDVTPEEHLAVLELCNWYIDSATSKTCNVPSGTPWDDFKDLYMKAWERGCKGCTTFQKHGKRAGILKAAEEAEEETPTESACYIDPETGRHECE